MKMRLEFGLDLVVVDPQARFFGRPRRHGKQQHQAQSQGTREDAQAAPQVESTFRRDLQEMITHFL